ncbi:WD repeat-containing protein 36 [Anabrus simplex]|uniref:WD repeat-containing protein 36 n=1 Tax=Anabrus simplex TaxID=316456 RepID=UPI0035A3778F
MAQNSRIFVRNRAIGYVSNNVPLVARYIKRRKENLVATCVGRCFHTYGCARFSLLSVSGLHSGDICCLSADAYNIFTSCECKIFAWRRGTELKHTYVGHERPVHLLLPFGPHLLSVDEDSVLKVWDIKSEELYLELSFNNDNFQITTIMHPSTYLNKILLGSRQGSMQLWNINSSKLIYTFHGWGVEITVLEQAPAVDVVAIGLANGKIILHNLKYDETVVEFMQDWGLVTTISFRTDGHPIMASGSLVGHIVFWNLEEKRVASQLLSAHNAAVTGMKSLPNEPLLVTSSPDNTLKMWIFDLPDGGARLLRLREGHSAPPTFIRFHGSNGHNILSAGGDSSLRIFSTVNETFNKSLGRASYNRKISKKKGRMVEDPLLMPPIVQFTSETTREKEWDNIAAIHLGLAVVTTWSYDKLKMGDQKLLPERLDSKKSKLDSKVTATCLCLTHCGNFVVIGYSSGHVDRFNIQSGLHRGHYGTPTAHGGPVRGVTTDALNHITVTGGSDALIKFWPFKNTGSKPSSKLHVEEPVAFFHSHRDNSLLAVALEDYSMVILDLDTRKVIRKFVGHLSQLMDAGFSPDSRWLVTSAMDCTIRTWDIPSAHLIDCFQVEAPCTSLTFSPTGELLATTHVNCLGVFLWFNKTLYAQVSLRPVPETLQFPLIDLPTTVGTADEQSEWEALDTFTEDEFKSPEQINEDLVTLSLVANSRWQNLLNIDIVRKRNKPQEPLKKPKSAPFFLPTLPSLQLQFDLSSEKEQQDSRTALLPQSVQSLTVFGKLLSDAGETEDFQPAIAKLKDLGPSAINFEIASLAPEGGGSISLMLLFMKLIESLLLHNKDFELAQAYLGLFLKTHGDVVSSEPELRTFIPQIQTCQLAGWQNLQDKLLYNLCVVQALKTS